MIAPPALRLAHATAGAGGHGTTLKTNARVPRTTQLRSFRADKEKQLGPARRCVQDGPLLAVCARLPNRHTFGTPCLVLRSGEMSGGGGGGNGGADASGDGDGGTRVAVRAAAMAELLASLSLHGEPAADDVSVGIDVIGILTSDILMRFVNDVAF